MEKSKKQLKDFESEIRPNSEFLGLFREELINMAEREHNKNKDKSSTQYTKKSQIEKTTKLGTSDSESGSETDSSFSSNDLPAKLIKSAQQTQLKSIKPNKSAVQSIRPNKPIIKTDTKVTKEMDIKVIEKAKPDIQIVSSTNPEKSESDKNVDSESKIRMLNDNLEKNFTKEKTEPIILDELELSEYEIIKLKEIVKYFVDIKR